MEVVLAAHSLAGLGGSETYVVTVADHLQRLGHDVWLHTGEAGRSTDAARALGLRVALGEHELPPCPDVLLVQDAVVACELAAHYPLTPQVFVAHSDIFDLQLPPQLPELVAVVVTLYDRVERRVRALAQPVREIVRLTQPIDIERFKPIQPLPQRARVALTLGNYVHGQRLEMLRRACDRAGVELRHVGQFGEGQRPADQVLNDADIVFGKARVVLEAMACGRAAYSFDHNGGDGWVTAASYELLAPDNFGGQRLPDAIDEQRLVDDLALYEPGMGVVNRDLVVAHHSATRHASALAEVLERSAGTPRSQPVDAPLRELARLVRLYDRADQQAFALRAECEALAGRTQRAEHRAAVLEQRELEQAALAAAAREREQELVVRIAELDAEIAQARRDLDAIASTRRWQTLQAVLGPVDRLRAGRGGSDGPMPAQPAPASLARAAALPPPMAPPALPPPMAPPAQPPPAPFVVGVPRSGTSLLRTQLDSHPELAIGPETGFGLLVAGLCADDADPATMLAALAELETWPDLALDLDTAMHALEHAEPWSPSNGLRALYGALAGRDGKPRWGDKTPLHLGCMTQLAAALPEAHFIHIVRDGRDVAASVRGLPFAPGDGSIETIARDWRERIGSARRTASGLAHYREVRFEALVAEPEAVLRELCAFVALDFDDAMLRGHEHAADRLALLPDSRVLGDAQATRADRIGRHERLMQPPDPARAGRWRSSLTADEIAQFEAAAGDMLAELGYETVSA